MGGVRIWNIENKKGLETAVAVIALAGSLFQHRVGMVVTTVQDIATEINRIRQIEKSPEEVSKSLFKILNNLVYLALISRGGLELSIIAFALQAVVNLIESRDEFKNDRWIEGVSNLLMAAVRLREGYTHYQELRRNWEIEATLKRFFVGKLGAKWQFPSDHLPIGVEVNGARIISWNVLNNAYIDWVTQKDSQGLNGSMISDLNVRLMNHVNSGVTRRDVVIAKIVQEMMTAQNHIIALQECSKTLLCALELNLSPDWVLVKSFEKRVDQVVILYNKSRFTHESGLSKTPLDVYPSVPGRPLQNVLLIDNQNGSLMRLVNCHIPGDPAKPCRQELANYVREEHKREPESTKVVIGDTNFERDEMVKAYQNAGFSDFSLHSPYKTNIDPEKKSKGIDHCFVIGDEVQSRDLTDDEVLSGHNFKEMVDLLSN